MKFEELRIHPFFTKFKGGINFQELYDLKIDPPTMPDKRAKGSFVNNFDNTFTNQEARLSDSFERKLSKTDDDDFGDFHFTSVGEDNFFHS